ncbi:hypothetical protein [Enhygromyxa salina]|nr:hypothetical protein [Enhygromyxa salina]
MSSQAVSSRLRAACRYTPKLRRGPLVAMDAVSVSARLRSVSEMGALCHELGRVGALARAS